ncbi:Vacuolar protein-sorting-associated protein 27 [Friedmanniomyces endolithicus]|nr:Vacuolar protein-sorting-associated protein 27 [Friedmanniomyces endolithicus]KAK0786218.1 Vacuolar protein-sorting-associated protein 27 [Friedmanniomyces endolithicus]KAK0817580.1 Vacuolar protein-sorting-associated protein 27 [Friedmanniomyces endolithicus]KAK0843080.1 Vacuolar protein-sorting-associated protein 27 [Friedmanniomyces endolithicus]KAK0900490.1 Vacuolar protein-sorting-associated protein 27 [Friedmanniomyces endolithicus]
MSSWFGGNAATLEFDKQVEEATASSLSNLALNLEIADTIRSKTITPKAAMQSLKKRLSNKNPNVQLSALELLDQCVKNGGTHFMQEIASREFMDNMVSLVKYDAAGGMGEREVRTKMLELIQTWATAAQGRDSLIYIPEIYSTLQREGYNFPPKEALAASMFDSNAPPEWSDGDVCMRCREKFTFTNRKHHCRNCGHVFDQNCSSKSLPLPHLGIMVPVRVDDGCYAKLAAKSGGTGTGQTAQSPSGGVTRTLWQDNGVSVPVRQSSRAGPQSQVTQPRAARGAEDSFDADLKRAMEMSLADSKGSAGAGYVSQAQVAQNSKPQTNGSRGMSTSKAPAKLEEDSEDADLKAAIAASLQDMEAQKTRHARELKQQSSASAAPPVASQYRPNNQFELTPVEGENINLFATLVDRLQHQPPGTILREPQIQELYESIGALRPKLARTYGETMSKHDSLLELHGKLSTVVRYYDRMLEERLASAYAPVGRYGQQRGSGMYPGLPTAPGAVGMHEGGGGGVENYYSGGAPQDVGYGQRNSAHGGYAPQQTTAAAPYPSFEERQPRMSSYGPPQPEAAYYQQQQQQSPYPPQQAPQQQQQIPQPTSAPYPTVDVQQQQQQQQPPMHRRPSQQQAYSQNSSQYAPSHTSQSSNPAIASPPVDQAASYYYDPQAQVPNTSASHQQQQVLPPSPEIYHQQPPYQQLQQQAQQQQQPTQQAQPYYPQQQIQQQPQPPIQQQQRQQWPQAPATGSGYGQEAFPAAPQHAPVAVKEESLIEL